MLHSRRLVHEIISSPFSTYLLRLWLLKDGRGHEKEEEEEENDGAEEAMRGRAHWSGPIEHWLIRGAFLPFITPRLINRGQVNSAICYFNDVSSYEINVADLDEERTSPPRRTSFNPARTIIFHFYAVAGYLAGYLAREKRILGEIYTVSLYFLRSIMVKDFHL